MKENVIVSTITGNTKLVGEYLSTLDLNDDVLYIGFWTDKGMADTKTLKYLESLNDKKIFLFGTCGFGLSDEYFKSIIDHTKEHINSSNTVIGSFICLGKMQPRVKEKYEKMEDSDKKTMLLRNFDLALSHPNEDDFTKLKNIIENLK